MDKSHGYASPTASFTAKKQTHTVSTQSSRTNPSSAQKPLPHAVPLVGQQLKEQGFSTTAARVIQSSWKSSTRKLYTCYVEKRISYCGKRNLNPIHSNVKEGINFLAELLDSGLGYSAINTARSALSSIWMVVHHLRVYLERTKLRRGDCKQLLSFQKPYQAVSKDTVSRWLKLVLKQAGIDISMFKAHSTRAASTSAAAASNIPLSTIMASAGWSNADTFSKLYHKPVMENEQIFGDALLQSLQSTNEDALLG